MRQAFTKEHVIRARQELARRDVCGFACLVDIPTVPLSDEDGADEFSVMKLGKLAAHHELILRKLQGVEDGSVPNLMLLLPPGSAKSTYADVVFVPWYMARRGRRNVILASYASDIAAKQGRRARTLVKSPTFERLMGVSLSNTTSAVDQWAMSNGSEFMAGGILSGLTGNRAHLGIIDDPMRGREQAESQTIRDKTWDAYLDDFCSRLIPGAPQIMILTRWHQDDLAGRILPEDWSGESGVFDGRDGREWHVICLPAIADREDDPLGRKIGETLWPEWFSLDHWKPFQKNHRTWSSLYQQKPTPEDGTFFKREWFKRYKPNDLPKRLRKYGTSDYAVTEGGGDYTVLRVWGVDAEGGIWLLPGGYKRKETPDKWFEAQIDLQAHHKPFAWFGEAGVIQKATEPGLKRRMRERKVHARLEWLPSISDKPTRARGAQARAAMGMVYIPEGSEGDALLAEYLAFPAGRHDDDVDNLSLIGRALDMAHPAIVPVDEKDDNNRPKDIYSRARSFGDSDGGGFYG